MVNLNELKEALKYWNDTEEAENKLLRETFNVKSYLSLLFNPEHFALLDQEEEGQHSDISDIDINRLFSSLSEEDKTKSIDAWNNREVVKSDINLYISNQQNQKELVLRAVNWYKEMLNS